MTIQQKFDTLNDRLTQLAGRVAQLERAKQIALSEKVNMGKVATAAYRIVEYCKTQLMEDDVLDCRHQAAIETEIRKIILETGLSSK